jgi:hypothetical protein
MPTLESVDPSILFCMFKGEPGTRKSTQALSFPKPQYWFSWDRKMSGILVPCRQWRIDPKEITYDDYDAFVPARVKLEQLQLKCPYKTLVVDSLTSCADMTLRAAIKMKSGVTRSSGQAAGKLVAGIAVNEIEDYNAESAALQELIALLKDIHLYHKVNVILIAHVVQAEYKTPGGVTHMSRTIVTAGKKVAPKIPAYCGEVYHFNIKKGMTVGGGCEYSLLTEHTGDDFARTAINLQTEIVFNDQPIYQNWSAPAIAKMKENPVQVAKI